ncbi:MAG: thioredoxin [Clostridia bacterium]
MEVKLTKDNFDEVISKGTVIVDFWATWCGPCRMLAPILEEIANENSDITVGKLNVDDEGAIAQKYGIMSIPALFVFKDGKLVNKGVGLMPKEKVLALLK